MWVLDCLDDVVDDIQAFFGVPDPLGLGCARFFRHAARLPLRDGAVRHTLATYGRDPGRDEPAAAPPPGDGGDGEHIAAVAAMSQHPGFPTIGYSGAG